MTVDQLLQQAYWWASAHNTQLLLYLGVCFPLVGILIAWLGKGGKTDADGKLYASIFIGFAVVLVVLEVGAILVASTFYHKSVFAADVLLVVTPPLCFGLLLSGIRLVFPLNQLATWRTLGDVLLFAFGCGVAFWFLSKFRGWGIIFFGSFLQLLVFIGLGYFVLRRLFSRAFGTRR